MITWSQVRSVPEKPLLWRYASSWPARESKSEHWVSYAVVDQTWKLVANNDLSYVERYDLSNDPYEQTGLKKQSPESVAPLLQKLKTWQKSLPVKPEGDVFSAERDGS
jgi:arylsulfatase A-like enzyme